MAASHVSYTPYKIYNYLQEFIHDGDLDRCPSDVFWLLAQVGNILLGTYSKKMHSKNCFFKCHHKEPVY